MTTHDQLVVVGVRLIVTRMMKMRTCQELREYNVQINDGSYILEDFNDC